MQLPTAWGNVSGLHLLNNTDLAALGWLPVADTPPAFDPSIQNLTRTGYSVGTTAVTAQWALTEKPLKDVQAAQINTIKSAFDQAAGLPVTDANGRTWSGGEHSGLSIFLACQSAMQKNLTDVTLWDSSNQPHPMTVADAMTVAAAIGDAYQPLFQKWQNLRAQVMAAKTNADVVKVVW